MNRRRGTIAIALLVLSAPLARADHACMDGTPIGHEVKRDKPFPRAWFRVGRDSIIARSLHPTLKKKYAERYVSGYEEGLFGDLCAKDGSGYLELSTSDFGQSAQYSESAPACAKCAELRGFVSQHPSGTGLRLGLTKAHVAAILRAPIDADVVTVTYEEKIVERGQPVWHSEVLGLEFRDGRLVRFDIHDFREGA